MNNEIKKYLDGLESCYNSYRASDNAIVIEHVYGPARKYHIKAVCFRDWKKDLTIQDVKKTLIKIKKYIREHKKYGALNMHGMTEYLTVE